MKNQTHDWSGSGADCTSCMLENRLHPENFQTIYQGVCEACGDPAEYTKDDAEILCTYHAYILIK